MRFSPLTAPELLSASVLLDSLGEGALLIDRGSRVAWVNHPFERLIGVDRDTLHGSDIDHFVHRHLMPCITEEECTAKITASLSNHQDVTELACTIRSPDCREHRVLFSSHVIQDEPFRGMRLVQFQDVTDRKRVEEALRESEKQYRTLFESAGDALLIHDLDGRFLDVNRATAERLGYSREELLAMDLTEIVPPEFAALMPNRIREVVKKGHMVFETAHLTRDGRCIPVEASARVIPYRGETAILSISRDIADRKRAEKKLLDSERNLAASQEIAHVGSYTWDLETDLLTWSDELYRILGLTPRGRSPARDTYVAFTYPDDREGVIRQIQSLIEGGEPKPGEHRIVRPDNTMRFVQTRSRVVRNERGRPRFVHGVVQDITEQKMAEDTLRKSEEKYQTLFDSIDEGFCIIEMLFDAAGKPVDYRFLETNRAFERQTGMHNAIGKRMREFVPNHEEHWFEIYGEIATTGEPKRFIRAAKPLMGGWYDVYAFPVGEPASNRVAILFNDITEWKRAEEALRENEERFRLLTENASDIVVVLDPGGYIQYASPSVKAVGGYAPEDLIGRSVLELAHPEDLPFVVDALFTATARPNERITLEVRIQHASGNWLYLDIIGANLLKEPAVRGILVNARDVTDRKRAEEALVRRTEELVRKTGEVEAARDEANIYLDIMTHDVRNANNVSSMYTDLLLDLAEGDLKTYAEKLHASIQRSSNILKNVATVRRIHEEHAGPVPVNLDAVIRGEIESFPGASIRYRDAHVNVLADGLLPTVFNNLIGNAVKCDGPDLEIAIRVEEEGSEVLVSVEDTGPGVPDEVKEKLFTRFERGMARGRGEGLGLFIVRTLVERYGGKVRVEDRVPGRPEEGAAFRFTLRKAENRA